MVPSRPGMCSSYPRVIEIPVISPNLEATVGILALKIVPKVPLGAGDDEGDGVGREAGEAAVDMGQDRRPAAQLAIEGKELRLLGRWLA